VKIKKNEEVLKMKKTKRFKAITAFALAAILMLAVATTAFAIAIFDEDGNIIENEPLPGGIMTLDITLGDEDFDWGGIVWPAFGSVSGEVVEFWQNDGNGQEFIRIQRSLGDFDADLEGQYSYFDFSLDANTHKMGEEIAIGDTILGFYDNMVPVPMIYPPQHVAVLLVNRDGDLPRIIVDRFDENWVSSAQQFHLKINEDTPIYFQGGDEFTGEISELIGRKLVVEFTISHRNIPETIPAPQKITVLYERAIHPNITIDSEWNENVPPNIEFDWDDYFGFENGGVYAFPIMETGTPDWSRIPWRGEDSDWSKYAIIITIDGQSRGVPNASVLTIGDSDFPNYVPLRAITEMMGFTPQWHTGTRGVTVDSPRGIITMTIGQNYYTLTLADGLALTYLLDDAPILVGGRTYVPLRFFRDVFGFNNAWWAGGNIALDNYERME